MRSRSPAMSAVLVVAAALLAAPGCCSRLHRAGSGRALAFASHTVARQTKADLRATGERLSNLPSALRHEWDRSAREIGVASRLYCGE